LQGFKDLSVEARYKTWTCGEDNTITLGCFEARPEDEGDYKVINDDISNISFVYVCKCKGTALEAPHK
jgi:hypothetical protein